MLSADGSYTFGQFDTLVNGVTQQTQTHTAFSVHVWVQNGRHRLSISHFSSFHLIGAQTVWRDLPLPFRNWLLEHRNLFFLVLYSTFPFFFSRTAHTHFTSTFGQFYLEASPTFEIMYDLCRWDEVGTWKQNDRTPKPDEKKITASVNLWMVVISARVWITTRRKSQL